MKLFTFFIFLFVDSILSHNITVTISSTKGSYSLNRGNLTAASPIPVCVGGFSISNTGITICNRDASGQTRQANEIDCVFPFQVNGVWYDTCTATGRQFYWCSIDTVYQNRFAACEQECPYLARVLVKNYPGSIHTSCVPRHPNAISLIPSQVEIQNILNVHNNIRSIVKPTAADMKALTWDFALSRIAQRKTDSCVFGHDCQGCRNLPNSRTLQIGQNAYGNSGGTYDASFWTNVILAFYTEAKNFVYGSGSTTGNYENVAHYTQIISSTSLKIGCGASKCGQYLYAYCNFASIQASPTNPYQSGPPCSQCAPQLCASNLCFCNKVCQNYGVLDPMTCTCRCQPYATGDLCEKLICDRTDQQYGCMGTNPMYCIYANTVQACPHMCGICRV